MNSAELSEYVKCARNPIYFLNNYGYGLNITKYPVSLDRIKCFEYQEDILRKYYKYTNNIVLKSRQCLPENTFIDTPDGPKPVQNIKKGDIVYSYNFDKNKYQPDVVQEQWECGKVNCIKIKLKDSRNFEVGENHPFFVVNKNRYVPAKELEINDEISDISIDFGSVNANPNEVKLLAYLLIDGSTIKQVKFTNNNIDYLNEFEYCVNETFPQLTIRKSAKEKGFDYFPHQIHGVSTINPIMEWCQDKNIAGKKTEFKLIPTEVFNWNKEAISLFINRLFAGDGWISILKKASNKRLELGIASPSREFLEQIKFLLKKYNIKCNIYEVSNMKLQKNRFYKLRITHSSSISTFINEIGIHKKITDEHLTISKSRVHNVKNTSTVRRLINTGLKDCFDISVTLNENYFINGLLTHNTGLSVITAAFAAWTILFRSDQMVLIIANDRNGAVRFLSTVKQFLDYLPPFLLPSERLKNNETEILFPGKEGKEGNKIKAVAAGKNAGRGETPTLLILDETAFIENAESIWTSASLSLTATKGKCIMISTPYGTGNLYHKTWVAADKRENDFIPTKIHWTQHPIYSKDKEEKTDEYGRKYWTSPWYEKESEKLGHDRVKIAQELDLSFEGSRALVIESYIVERYQKELIGKEKPFCYYNYREEGSCFIQGRTDFWIWKLPEPNVNYILAADVGRGDGADFSTIQILNADTLEQVAEYQGKIPPDLFASIIQKAGIDYNKAYVVIECNNFGLATCLTLKNQLKYDVRRIHHSKSVKKLVNHHYGVEVDENGEIPGFQTTKESRTLIIASLTSYLRGSKIQLHSSRLINEFNTFIYNGIKAEHAPGYHDDLIIALGIGLLIRDTESNVFKGQEFYKQMISSISYSNSNETDSESKYMDDKFKQRAQEQYKLPDVNKPNTTNDDDLRWLLGSIMRD